MPERSSISIIIPVYNAKRSIGLLWKSILQQTMEPWEILLIDDCSTDGTGELLAEETKKHPGWHLLSQESHQGPAAACNRGIEVAQGDYIIFLSTNGTVEADLLIRCQQNIAALHPDVTIYGVHEDFFDDKGSLSYSITHTAADTLADGNPLALASLAQDLERESIYGIPWNKVYKKSLLLDNNLRFSKKGMGLAETFSFNRQVLDHSSRVLSLSDAPYHYRKEENAKPEKRPVSEILADFQCRDAMCREFLEQQKNWTESQSTEYEDARHLMAEKYFQAARTFIIQSLDSGVRKSEIVSSLQGELQGETFQALKDSLILDGGRSAYEYRPLVEGHTAAAVRHVSGSHFIEKHFRKLIRFLQENF